MKKNKMATFQLHFIDYETMECVIKCSNKKELPT